MRLRETLHKLAAREQAFLGQTFLAPVARGGLVRVRVAGVSCQLRIEPPTFQGWGVFQPTSYVAARWQRSATLAERQRYLELFPAVALILMEKMRLGWLGLPTQGQQLGNMVAIHFVEDGQRFDVVQARHDGAAYWADGPDPQHDPRRASYLRQALADLKVPQHLSLPGLTAPERAAYERVRAARLGAVQQQQRHTGEQRLQAALAHGGAVMTGFVERADVYVVTYAVDSEEHVSLVRKNDLTVQSAGICLSGEDEHFDLASLVGVIRGR